MNRDEVTKHEEAYLGDVVRLEIPIKSLMNLRRVAEELRGLAHRLECIGRFAERPAAAMIEAQMIVKATNKRLDEIRSRGRPKRSRNKY